MQKDMKFVVDSTGYEAQCKSRIKKLLLKYNVKFLEYLKSDEMSDYLEDINNIYVVRDKQQFNQYRVKYFSTKRIPHGNVVCIINYGINSASTPNVVFYESVSVYLLKIINDLVQAINVENIHQKVI